MAPQKKARDRKADSTPWLEWAASSIGLLLVVALLGVLGWDAVHHAGGPPAVRIETGRIVQDRDGYTVEIRVSNAGDATAANVRIEGRLSRDGGVVERAQVQLDFVPGDSARRGGLFFTNDPRRYDLQVRALGYAQP